MPTPTRDSQASGQATSFEKSALSASFASPEAWARCVSIALPPYLTSDVLGHRDVGGDAELLLATGLFEDLLGDVFCGVGFEEGLAAVTAEGDEVEVLCLLVAYEAGGHGGASSLHPTLRKSAKDGAPEGLCLVRSYWVGHPA